MRWVRLVGVLAVLSATSCSLALKVHRSVEEEVVREPLGSVVSVAAERQKDDLQITVRRAERVRETRFDVETVERRHVRYELRRDDNVMFVEVFQLGLVVDLAMGIAAPFRAENDVVLGPLGVLVAAIVPGISLLGSNYEGDVWDTATQRRPKGSREVDERATGIATFLRVVTDRDVFEVGTDDLGIATIPLDRLFGPALAPGSVTLAHGNDMFRVHFDGTAVSSEAVPKEPTK